MTDRDPVPLTDPGSGTPEILREALQSAQSRAPSASDLARLAARLPLGPLPPAAPPAGSAGPAAPPAGSAGPAAPTGLGAAPPTALSGALIGAALGVLVSGAGLVWDARHAPPHRAISPRAVVTAEAGAPPRAAIEAPRVPPLNTPPPDAVTARAPRPAPAEASAPAAADPAAAVPVTENESAGAGADPIDTETEAHLLQRAEGALSSSPARALALAEAHAVRFPAGPLGQEREVVAIQALLRLGRAEEARARGARFAAAFPGSAHRRRIEALLGR